MADAVIRESTVDFVPTKSSDCLSSPRKAGTQYTAAPLGLLGRPVKQSDDTKGSAMPRTRFYLTEIRSTAGPAPASTNARPRPFPRCAAGSAATRAVQPRMRRAHSPLHL